jgi:hypothetical protein
MGKKIYPQSQTPLLVNGVLLKYNEYVTLSPSKPTLLLVSLLTTSMNQRSSYVRMMTFLHPPKPTPSPAESSALKAYIIKVLT